MNAASLFQPRWLLAAVTAALVVSIGLMLAQTAHAGSPPDLDSTQCKFVGPGVQYCISLDPLTDTNPVDDDHTATASLSVFVDGDPVDPTELEPVFVVILVFDGPNVGESQSVIAQTNTDGQLALTYTGDGGPGADTIATVACLDPLDLQEDAFPESVSAQQDSCNLQGFIDFCLEASVEECIDDLTGPNGTCTGEAPLICDIAAKEWVEEPTPTPTPAPSATPTTAPTAAPAAALPSTGADPTSGSACPLAGTLALVLGGMALLAVGAGVARRAR